MAALPLIELALIDAICPFFQGYHKRRINWSKIPFTHLATLGPKRMAQWQAIRRDLILFAEKARALSCNAVSLRGAIGGRGRAMRVYENVRAVAP